MCNTPFGKAIGNTKEVEVVVAAARPHWMISPLGSFWCPFTAKDAENKVEVARIASLANASHEPDTAVTNMVQPGGTMISATTLFWRLNVSGAVVVTYSVLLPECVIMRDAPGGQDERIGRIKEAGTALLVLMIFPTSATVRLVVAETIFSPDILPSARCTNSVVATLLSLSNLEGVMD